MAEHGEWNRKGASLSDVTAQKEFGVTRDFIEDGIRAGKLEYRRGSIWGNPYLKILRSQLEAYLAERLGSTHVELKKAKADLKKIEKEIRSAEAKLVALLKRKAELEATIQANN